MKLKNPFLLNRRRKGVALVLVVIFMALLTVLLVAYLSRASNSRQAAGNSFQQTSVDGLARGAFAIIVGDLKQEIVNGSTTATVGTAPHQSQLYFPTNVANAVPVRSGNPGTPPFTTANPDPIPNLTRRSVRSDAIGSPGVGSRASAVNSTTDVSSNGRYVSQARWNKHYLIPRLNVGSTATDSTPVAAFAAPDWVFVTSAEGAKVITAPDKTIGRYAYAIYDEGGLLDVNAVGYPQGTPTAQSAYKSSLAFADLTTLPYPIPNTSSSNLVDQIVGWRNYATAKPSGAFGSFAFSSTAVSNYYKAVASSTTGFLKAGTQSFNSRTDQMFLSRQQLLAFRSAVGFPQDTLQYLTTFSRDINQPSFIPAVQSNAAAPIVLAASLGGNSAVGGDKFINPSFPNTRVQASFTRNDGSTANVGDPLVNKRFALQRLAWVTYKGPSATRTQSDADIQAVINSGIPWSYLQLGTDANIQKYFGLAWDAANNRWLYNVHNGGNTGQGIIMLVGRPAGTAANATTYVQDANRDPDFFELLKAGITVGSLGKASASSNASVPQANAPKGYSAAQVPVNVRYNFDSAVDYHVIQIGANILSEVNPTSYPIRIAFHDGSARGLWEFQGVTDLPYLNYVFNGVLRTQLPNPLPQGGGGKAADSSPFQYPVAVTGAALTVPGKAYMIQVPAVWNPYDPNGTSGVLRPSQFRIVVDSNDPLSPSGSGNLPIWHGAVATGNTSGPAGNNAGLGPPSPVYSWTVNGVGKTTEIPGTNGTPVNDAVTFNDSNGTLYHEPTLIFNPAVGSATRTAGNITGIDANPLPGETDNSKGPWAPLVLGQFPLAFASTTTTNTTYYTGTALIGLAAGNGDNRVYFTYRLQYKDASGNWITYDTKYGRTTHGLFAFQAYFNQTSPFFSPSVVTGPDGFNPYSWAAAMDPRTARFGLIMDTVNIRRSTEFTALAPPALGWLYDSGGATKSVGITFPIRQDNTRGLYFANQDQNNVPSGGQTGGNSFGLLALPSTKDIPYPSFSAGWTTPGYTINPHGPSDIWIFAPGMYAQNNPSAPFSDGIVEPSYYADPDGVVRRAAGAYVPFGSGVSASTPVGLPPASINGYSGAPSSLVTPASNTPFTQSQSRPLLLHRPFRSVAELGYVFRDVPWKNLDFFTPESGDIGLLDLFCINESSDPNGLVAGKVNLNTRQAPVLAAIIGQAYIDDPKVSNATVGSISTNVVNTTTVATTIASALVARTADTTHYGPLQNLSELVGKWKSSAGAISSGVTYSPKNQGSNWGIDLPSPYIDGKACYTGFSGAASTSSGTAENLTDAYATASYSTTAATQSSMQAGMSQIQRFHEAPIRALANVGQTRVWNLMIDVVAQTGRYPRTSVELSKFVVEGEQHLWVHIAIDRTTGKILDQQIEVVKE